SFLPFCYCAAYCSAHSLLWPLKPMTTSLASPPAPAPSPPAPAPSPPAADPVPGPPSSPPAASLPCTSLKHPSFSKGPAERHPLSCFSRQGRRGKERRRSGDEPVAGGTGGGGERWKAVDFGAVVE
ncbi:unnamed protein product, partial [Closterium sp. NIES-53]